MQPSRGNAGEGPVTRVAVADLITADSPRIAGESDEHVAALASAPEELPPLLVHRATMRVIDGAHRLKAAVLRGETTVAVRFYDGDEADVFVLAVRTNIAHGLPLSLADRKRAAARIAGTHPQWSDRMVASATGLSAATVAEIRRGLPAPAPADGVRVGQDGRLRPVDGSGGRRLAVELITANPDLSLRQVARSAGISPETVRDVRNRLQRGEDPVAVRRRQGAAHRARLSAARRPARPELRDRAALVTRLRSDPALRFNESGRTLLMLLNMLTIGAAGWDRIVATVPDHWRRTIAELCRDCAELWLQVAVRVEAAGAQPRAERRTAAHT